MRELTGYLSSLTVSQGRFAGEAFRVLPWESRFVRGAFAPGVQTAALSVARGNGKTALLAGIATATLDGPLMVPRGETIIVASSFAQGRIAFDFVAAYLGRERLKDRARWRVWDSPQQAGIENRESGASLRVLGSDPRRAHGLAPVLVLADEPAQWPASTGERMRAALVTAAGKQPHSRFVALGTRPADEGHWFAGMLSGGADYAQCHAAGPDDSRFNRRTWAKANPSLNHLPDLEAAIRREAKAAKSDPGMLAAFEALRLNLGTDDTERALLLDAGLWRSIEGKAAPGGRCAWGVDLGTNAAQSAVAAYWPDTGALAAVAAFPSVPSLTERGLRDGVSGLYTECAKRGELLTLGNNTVDVGALIDAARARFGVPSVIAADRWREADLRDALERAGIPLAGLDLRGMGWRDGAEDVRAFRRACAEGRVTPPESLLLRAAMSEARVLVDPAGNAKLAKHSEGGRRARARDDAAAAAILAVASGTRAAARPRPRRLRHALAG